MEESFSKVERFFKIVQMVPNRAKRHRYTALKMILVHLIEKPY